MSQELTTTRGMIDQELTITTEMSQELTTTREMIDQEFTITTEMSHELTTSGFAEDVETTTQLAEADYVEAQNMKEFIFNEGEELLSYEVDGDYPNPSLEDEVEHTTAVLVFNKTETVTNPEE